MATSRINEIHIQNFKFFPECKKPIYLDGKHLLLYGENGSGKSSIYWALYTLLECANKSDVNQIKKYFDTTDVEHLTNINCDTSLESYIKIKLTDNTIFNVSYFDTAINTHEEAQESNYSSDFLTYRNLLSLYNFAHSEPIDLIHFFSYAIFPYIKFKPITIKGKDTENAGEIFKYVSKGLQQIEDDLSSKGKPRYPLKDEPEYIEYDKALSNFKNELDALLLFITTEGNRILRNNLNYDFTFSLSSETDVSNKRKPKLSIRLKIPNYQGKSNVVYRPHSFLNEAKLTALGLVIRLAVLEKSLEPNSKLNILVLDDLLISLDMNNRDKVLELILKEYTNKYQLLILTHDRNFFEFTRHRIDKLKQIDWVYREMYSTEKDSILQPYIKQSDTYLDKAKKYLSLKEYEIAGNFLRKEAEAFCKEFLPKKYHYTSEFELREFNGLIQQCLIFAEGAGLDKTLFEALDSYRKFVLNPTSHDSYDVPKFESEVRACLDTLTELRKIKYEPFLKRGEQVEFELSNGVDTYKFEIILEDDFRLLQEPGKDSVISKGMVNYWVYKNGIKTKNEIQHRQESLQKMYNDKYAQSDQTKNADFWEEIVISATGAKLKVARKF